MEFFKNRSDVGFFGSSDSTGESSCGERYH